MKILVLGLGNPILGDDGVGITAAALLEERLPPGLPVEVDTDYHGGLHLMERLVGYDLAIIIDAICTGTHPPGTILRLGPDDVPTQHTASAHDVNLPTALAMARRMRLTIPQEICIIAIEAQNVLQFNEHCTPAVEAALPRAVDAALAQLREWTREEGR